MSRFTSSPNPMIDVSRRAGHRLIPTWIRSYAWFLRTLQQIPPLCETERGVGGEVNRGYIKPLFTLLGALAMLLLLAGQTGIVTAQGGTPTVPVTDNDVNRVAKTLYCPVCQNVPLEVCGTEACARWREQVRELLQQGKTDDEIRQYFIVHFGSKTVGTPTDTTSEILTVVLPFGIIAVIGVVIVATLIHWRRGQVVAVNGAATVDIPPPDDGTADDYRARLEAEVKKRE